MNAECVPKASVMIWGCITWYGVGTLCQVNGNINAEKLGWPYHTMNVVIMLILIPLYNPSPMDGGHCRPGTHKNHPENDGQ
jgi:hypothetical protein